MVNMNTEDERCLMTYLAKLDLHQHKADRKRDRIFHPLIVVQLSTVAQARKQKGSVRDVQARNHPHAKISKTRLSLKVHATLTTAIHSSLHQFKFSNQIIAEGGATHLF